MPKMPLAMPVDSPRCDPRLPEAALAYRRAQRPSLTTARHLGAINVTAWLFVDQAGVEGIQVNPNITIAELLKEFGPGDPDVDLDVGFHSEGRAAQWFRTRQDLRVLQIFSERIPCFSVCSPMLRHYYPGVPWYYYYDPRTWRTSGGGLMKRAAQVLTTAYRI